MKPPYWDPLSVSSHVEHGHPWPGWFEVTADSFRELVPWSCGLVDWSTPFRAPHPSHFYFSSCFTIIEADRECWVACLACWKHEPYPQLFFVESYGIWNHRFCFVISVHSVLWRIIRPMRKSGYPNNEMVNSEAQTLPGAGQSEACLAGGQRIMVSGWPMGMKPMGGCSSMGKNDGTTHSHGHFHRERLWKTTKFGSIPCSDQLNWWWVNAGSCMRETREYIYIHICMNILWARVKICWSL